jgi:hypothetical protein
MSTLRAYPWAAAPTPLPLLVDADRTLEHRIPSACSYLALAPKM